MIWYEAKALKLNEKQQSKWMPRLLQLSEATKRKETDRSQLANRHVRDSKILFGGKRTNNYASNSDLLFKGGSQL